MRRRLLCSKKVDAPSIVQITSPMTISITKPDEKSSVSLDDTNLIVFAWPNRLSIEFDYDGSTVILDTGEKIEDGDVVKYQISASNINAFFEENQVMSDSLTSLKIRNMTRFGGVIDELKMGKLNMYSVQHSISPLLAGGTINAILSYVYLEEPRVTSLPNNLTGKITYYVHSNHTSWKAKGETNLTVSPTSGGSSGTITSNKVETLTAEVTSTNNTALSKTYTLTVTSDVSIWGVRREHKSTITQPGKSGTGGDKTNYTIILYFNFQPYLGGSVIQNKASCVWYVDGSIVTAGNPTNNLYYDRCYLEHSVFNGFALERLPANSGWKTSWNGTKNIQYSTTLSYYGDTVWTINNDSVIKDTPCANWTCEVPSGFVNDGTYTYGSWTFKYDGWTYTVILDMDGSHAPKFGGLQPIDPML